MPELRWVIADALTPAVRFRWGDITYPRRRPLRAADAVLAALGLPAVLDPDVTYSTGHGWLAVPGRRHVRLEAAERVVEAAREGWSEHRGPHDLPCHCPVCDALAAHDTATEDPDA